MPRVEQNRSILVRNVVIGVIIAGLIAVALYFGVWKRGDRNGSDSPSPSSSASPQDIPSTVDSDSEDLEPAIEPESEAARRWVQLLDTPAVWPADLHGAVDCAEVERQLGSVCDAVDLRQADIVKPFGGSCELFRDVGRSLAGKPPILAAETRSLDATLQNTFHLFRVLGRKRIKTLLALVEAEPETIEPVGFALYRWATSREACAEPETVTVPMERLHDYAGFLFRSLGGQAYLRRRNTEVEALTCFYALQVLDLTIEAGHNPHGIDPRGEVGRCSSLVQSGDFLFKERYVELLDQMASRWKDRGSIAN